MQKGKEGQCDLTHLVGSVNIMFMPRPMLINFSCLVFLYNNKKVENRPCHNFQTSDLLF